MSFSNQPIKLSGGAWGNLRNPRHESHGNGTTQSVAESRSQVHADFDQVRRSLRDVQDELHNFSDSNTSHNTQSGDTSYQSDRAPEARRSGSKNHDTAVGDRTIIILRGLPGSGKSTLAKTFGGVILSADDFFVDNTGMYNFDPKRLQDAHAWAVQRTRTALHDGLSPVCIDNTNTQLWEMQPYVQLALEYGYAVQFREPTMPWRYDVAALAQHTVHRVPPATIQKMLTGFYRGPLTLDVVMHAARPTERPPYQPREPADTAPYQSVPTHHVRRSVSHPSTYRGREKLAPSRGGGRDVLARSGRSAHGRRETGGRINSGGYYDNTLQYFPNDYHSMNSYTPLAPQTYYTRESMPNPHAYDACRPAHTPPDQHWTTVGPPHPLVDQHWMSVGPPHATVDQHYTSVGPGLDHPVDSGWQGHGARVRRRSGRFLLVIDVNGLLVDRVKKQHIKDYSVRPDFVYGTFVAYERPHARRFVRWLLDNFDVAVWSSAQMQNILPVVKHIMGDKFSRVLHMFDQKSCVVRGTVLTERGSKKPRFVKPLTAVWERIGEGAHIDPVTTLLIDDDAFKAELNPPFTAIHPPVFSHAACQTPGDGTDVPSHGRHDRDLRVNAHNDPRSVDRLLDLRDGPLYHFLRRLANEAVDVPSFVQQNPFR